MSYLEHFSRTEEIALEKGYTIDKDGNVYGLKGRRLEGYLHNGYKCFNIRDKSNKTVRVAYHRFQAYFKFGNKIYEKGMVVRHLDGNSLNNSIFNLEIGTQYDNIMDQSKEVRIKKASNANKVYSDEIVKQIMEDREKGLTYKDLMKKYNISSKGTLSFIINKRIRN